MARVAGTTYVNVNGTSLALKGSITVGLSDSERESVTGIDGRHGWKETKVSPFVEITCTIDKDLDLNEMTEIDGATITVELANGKNAVLSNATQMLQPQISPEEGEVTFRFEGEKGTYV